MVVVIGSSNTDMIIQVPRIPGPGETILGGAFHTAAGGKGANQAVAAARAGAEVAFIARVGADMFGERAVAGFKADGLDVQYVKIDDSAPSGVAQIFVAEDGENSITVAGGANANLCVDDVKAAGDVMVNAEVVLMQLETPIETIAFAASLAHENSVPVLLNPAPAQKLPPELLRHVTILTPNESEAELLTGLKVNCEENTAIAARMLRDMGPKDVIITLGATGVFLSTSDFEGLIPAFKTKAIDTTAAGDVFNGALAAALAENMPMRRAVQFSQAAAALSVTKLGAQPSAPRREDIEALLKRTLQ